MASGDQLSIVNRALLGIGARAQVSSISPSDGSTEGDAGAVLFTPTFEALARTAHWNCIRKQAVLSLIAAAQGTPENPNGTTLPIPPTPWLYAYQYPSDCLNMRFLIPSFPAGLGGVPQTTYNNAAGSMLPNSGQIPFQVSLSNDNFGNPITIVLANQSQAQAVYTANVPNPSIWDSLFQQAMVSALGAFFVPALNMNSQLMDRAISQAENMISTARAADGNEGVTVMDHVPDWIARRGVSVYCNGGGVLTNGCYFSMPWPGQG